ncbi:hypothetical protein [Sporosarcina highlanderae]|uniref:Uncharacterized protein n=1 Tax=Sporosarcina highlanderae TaxID=3035916 RepID=A0ABT8JL97_9BACL|nr:hypothetical protein [Sporosarcina highlanderae]MDN4605916.1 hypothetical protein [Sporosarcina highlanderae]
MQEVTAPATGLTTEPREEIIFGEPVHRRILMVPRKKIAAKKLNKQVREFHEEVDAILEAIQDSELVFNLIEKLTIKKILNDSKLAVGFGHIMDQEVIRIRLREFLLTNGTSGNQFLGISAGYLSGGKYFG